MTLLITIIAALVSTIIWYQKAPADDLKISTLCFIFWGASLMWMVDAVFEYQELQAAYFTPTVEAMINDAFLGVCVVTLGVGIWFVNLLIKDPQGKIKAIIINKT